MSESSKPKPEVGSVGWIDLTIENAEQVKDFYSQVVGWKPDAVSMGGYNDFNMNSRDSNTPTVGICHARGPNAAMPPHWMIYIIVENLEHSLERCQNLGGQVVVPLRELGGQGRFGVIKDPAGAVAALFEPPA